ncbi:MAG: ROK family protein [candidate division WOR-3 bacterium]|nr:ROK family protein [candidate division WOR-3 bacterium]MCX7836420.1 ROK family protein [candidate division WOR-3 bacterium]MDW8113737.1 ROK family protein [candidate division WOR-3 bacterium]
MKIKEGLFKISLGIDIGGTNIKIGLVKNNKIIKKGIFKTEKDLDNQRFGNYLIEIIKGFIKDYKIDKIGIGIAGYVFYEKGILKFSPNLPKLKNFSLKEVIEKHFLVETFVLNDADAMAIGEYFYHNKKYKNLITITLGTGVGSGIIVNNKLLYNSEFGHTILIPFGALCSCGKKGCVESYLGSYGMLRIAREFYKRGIKNLTPKKIYEMAKNNEERALKTIEKYSFYLAIALSNLINIFNPEIVILNGGISNMGNLLLKFIRPMLKENTFYLPKIKISNLKIDAGIIGAVNFNLFKDK